MKKEDFIDLYLKLDQPYGIGYNFQYNEYLFRDLEEY